MGKKILWSNVRIDLSTTLAAAIAITSITMGASTVVAYSGAVDPANGDEILLDIPGSQDLNGKVYRVASVNAAGNTLVLEGLDSTGFDAVTSGNFQQITGWATSSIITSVNASGGEAQFKDATTVHDRVQVEVPSISTGMKCDFDAMFDPSDPYFREANKASKTNSIRVSRFRFATGARMLGSAYVSASGVPTGSAQDLVKTKMSLSFQGLPTIYES
jgi:Phage tail tube protein, TTP